MSTAIDPKTALLTWLRGELPQGEEQIPPAQLAQILAVPGLDITELRKMLSEISSSIRIEEGASLQNTARRFADSPISGSLPDEIRNAYNSWKNNPPLTSLIEIKILWVEIFLLYKEYTFQIGDVPTLIIPFQNDKNCLKPDQEELDPDSLVAISFGPNFLPVIKILPIKDNVRCQLAWKMLHQNPKPAVKNLLLRFLKERVAGEKAYSVNSEGQYGTYFYGVPQGQLALNLRSMASTTTQPFLLSLGSNKISNLLSVAETQWIVEAKPISSPHAGSFIVFPVGAGAIYMQVIRGSDGHLFLSYKIAVGIGKKILEPRKIPLSEVNNEAIAVGVDPYFGSFIFRFGKNLRVGTEIPAVKMEFLNALRASPLFSGNATSSQFSEPAIWSGSWITHVSNPKNGASLATFQMKYGERIVDLFYFPFVTKHGKFFIIMSQGEEGIYYNIYDVEKDKDFKNAIVAACSSLNKMIQLERKLRRYSDDTSLNFNFVNINFSDLPHPKTEQGVEMHIQMTPTGLEIITADASGADRAVLEFDHITKSMMQYGDNAIFDFKGGDWDRLFATYPELTFLIDGKRTLFVPITENGRPSYQNSTDKVRALIAIVPGPDGKPIVRFLSLMHSQPRNAWWISEFLHGNSKIKPSTKAALQRLGLERAFRSYSDLPIRALTKHGRFNVVMSDGLPDLEIDLNKMLRGQVEGSVVFPDHADLRRILNFSFARENLPNRLDDPSSEEIFLGREEGEGPSVIVQPQQVEGIILEDGRVKFDLVVAGITFRVFSSAAGMSYEYFGENDSPIRGGPFSVFPGPHQPYFIHINPHFGTMRIQLWPESDGSLPKIADVEFQDRARLEKIIRGEKLPDEPAPLSYEWFEKLPDFSDYTFLAQNPQNKNTEKYLCIPFVVGREAFIIVIGSTPKSRNLICNIYNQTRDRGFLNAIRLSINKTQPLVLSAQQIRTGSYYDLNQFFSGVPIIPAPGQAVQAILSGSRLDFLVASDGGSSTTSISLDDLLVKINSVKSDSPQKGTTKTEPQNSAARAKNTAEERKVTPPEEKEPKKINPKISGKIHEIEKLNPKTLGRTRTIQWPNTKESGADMKRIVGRPLFVSIGFPDTQKNWSELINYIQNSRSPIPNTAWIQWGENADPAVYEFKRSGENYLLLARAENGEAPIGDLELKKMETGFQLLFPEEETELEKILSPFWGTLFALSVEYKNDQLKVSATGKYAETLIDNILSRLAEREQKITRDGNVFIFSSQNDEDVISILSKIKNIYENIIKENQIGPKLIWQRSMRTWTETLDLPAQNEIPAAQISVRLREVKKGDAEHIELCSLKWNREELKPSIVKINGIKVENLPVTLTKDDMVKIEYDSTETWQNVELLFDGKSLIEIHDERRISFSDQILARYDTTNPLAVQIREGRQTIQQDDSAILTGVVFKNPRTGNIHLTHAQIIFSFDSSSEKKESIKISDLVFDEDGSAEVFIDHPLLGSINLELSWKDERLNATRLVSPEESFIEKYDSGKIFLKHRGVIHPLHTLTRGGKKAGTKPILLMHPDDAQKVHQIFRFAGKPIDFDPNQSVAIEISGTEIELRNVGVTTEGEISPRVINLRRPEGLLIREALDGVPLQHAAYPNQETYHLPISPLSQVQDFSFSPGESFHMTKNTIDLISSLQQIALGTELWLEFENQDGLLMRIPVILTNRSNNPFKLDADGQFIVDSKKNFILGRDGKPQVRGRRIEIGRKGFICRPVGYDIQAYDMNGNWNIYGMTSDPQLGAFKAFHFEIARYQYAVKTEDNTVERFTSPVLFSVVNTVDKPQAEIPLHEQEETLFANKRQYKTQAIRDLYSRLVRYNKTEQEWPQVHHLPLTSLHVRSGEGNNIDLIFGSDESLSEDLGRAIQISGMRFNRTRDELILESSLQIQIFTYGDTSSTEILEVEPILSWSERILLLSEKGGKRVFTWNLMTGELIEKLNVPEDIEGAARKSYIILRNKNIPLVEHEKFTEIKKQLHPVGEISDVELRILGNDGQPLALPIAPPIVTEPTTSLEGGKPIAELLPGAGTSLFPDSVSAILTSLACGGPHVLLRFATPDQSVILEIPYARQDQFPHDYQPSEKADPVRGNPAARLLIRNPDTKRGEKARANIQREGHSTEAREYQWEAVDAAVMKYFGEGENIATVVLPTGTGKTNVAKSVFDSLLAQEKFNLDRDVVLVFTHLLDNLDQLGRFGDSFPQLTSSRVQGKERDYNGQIIYVSIPTAALEIEKFKKELTENLSGRKIRFCVIDEFHHGGANTFQSVVQAVQELEKESLFLGLTATPRGNEINIVYQKNPQEMMAVGAIPRVAFVRIPGITLSSLRDHTAIKSDQRHRMIMEALESYAPKKAGERHLEPVQISALDISHALSIANFYQRHCAEGLFDREGNPTSEAFRSYKAGKNPLRARRVGILGVTEKTRSGEQVFQNKTAIEDSIQKGNFDAFVAVISGSMEEEALHLIKKLWEEGKIETVICVGKWVEAFDGYFIRTQINAAPGFEDWETTQFLGRLFRFSPEEYNQKSGEILKPSYRVAIQIDDKVYRGRFGPSETRPLSTYMSALGHHTILPAGVPWDLVEDRPFVEKPKWYSFPAIFHPKKLPGGIQMLECGLPNGEILLLQQLSTRDTYGGGQAFAFHVHPPNGREANSRATKLDLITWIESLNLGTVSRVRISQDPFIENQWITPQIEGFAINLQGRKIRDESGRLIFEIQGFRIIPEQQKVVLDITWPDGTIGELEVQRTDRPSGIIFLEDKQRKKKFFAVISQEGFLEIFDLDPRFQIFQPSAESTALLMRSIDGNSTYNDRESHIVRTSLSHQEPYFFNINLPFGRWRGTGHTDAHDAAQSQRPFVSFDVGIDTQDGLIVRFSAKDFSEKYLPFQNGEIQIFEEKFFDERIGREVRGKVRVYFKKEGEEKTSPYGWIEFENREALLGTNDRFSPLGAHYHERNAFFERKILPDSELGLIQMRAGLSQKRETRDWNLEQMQKILAPEEYDLILGLLIQMMVFSEREKHIILRAISILSKYPKLFHSRPQRREGGGFFSDEDVAGLAQIAHSQARSEYQKRQPVINEPIPFEPVKKLDLHSPVFFRAQKTTPEFPNFSFPQKPLDIENDFLVPAPPIQSPDSPLEISAAEQWPENFENEIKPETLTLSGSTFASMPMMIR